MSAVLAQIHPPHVRLENNTHDVRPDGPVDLDVRTLCKAFDPRRPILDSVSFAVHRREAVALIGANGAGKSTLLRCCLGLIEPEAGSVFLLDREIGKLPGRELRRMRARVGFVFQKHNLVLRSSALSNVIHGALGAERALRLCSHVLAPQAIRARAIECLRKVGMDHLADQRADRLSGGQSQRVAVARALVAKPQIVFADEPVASLDPHVGEEVMALFSALVQDQGLTLVFTTHNLDHALKYSKRIIGLKNGHVRFDAPIRSLSKSDLASLYA